MVYIRKTLQKTIIICMYYNLQYIYKWRKINQTRGISPVCSEKIN